MKINDILSNFLALVMGAIAVMVLMVLVVAFIFLLLSPSHTMNQIITTLDGWSGKAEITRLQGQNEVLKSNLRNTKELLEATRTGLDSCNRTLDRLYTKEAKCRAGLTTAESSTEDEGNTATITAVRTADEAEPVGLPEIIIYKTSVRTPPKDSPCEWEGQLDRMTYRRIRGPYKPKGFDDMSRADQASAIRTCWPREKGWTWTKVLDEAVSRFQTEVDYEDPRVHAAYGLLQGGNNRIFDKNAALNRDFRRSLRVIYGSSTLRRAVYAWAMPKVTAAFLEMDPKDQQIYLSILHHAHRYIYSDGPEQDMVWWKELSSGVCDRSNRWLPSAESWKQRGRLRHRCTHLFRVVDSDGTEGLFRKVEAWMWRRIYFDGMSREVLQHYVTRAIRDLEAALE